MKPLIYPIIGISIAIAFIVGIVFLVLRNIGDDTAFTFSNTPHQATIDTITFTWEKVSTTTELTSDNVSVRWLKRTSINPYSYEVYKVLATSTPNTSWQEGFGEYDFASTSPFFDEFEQEENEYDDGSNVIEVGCIDAKVECRAVLFNI